MARLLAIFLLALMLFAPGTSAGGVSLKNLDLLEDRALADRLLLILEAQVRRTWTCRHPEAVRLRAELAEMTFQPDSFKSADMPSRKSALISLIRATMDSARFRTLCPRLREQPAIVSIRREIQRPPGLEVTCAGETNRLACIRFLYRWYDALRPSCFRIREQGLLNNLDGNACFAGDGIMLSSLKSANLVVYREGLKLAGGLLDAVAAAGKQSTLELFEVYRGLGIDLEVRSLITLWAALGTSGNSGVTGWLQGLEDRTLLEWLVEEDVTPEEVYLRFKEFQAAKIAYQKFRDVVDRKKIKLTLLGTTVNSWNRHNLMAAFLGCAQRTGSPELTQRMILMIGRAYESKDFVSHILQGVSWKASVENWKSDTARYANSSRIGLQACR